MIDPYVLLFHCNSGYTNASQCFVYTYIACLVLKIPFHENHACLCIHNYILYIHIYYTYIIHTYYTYIYILYIHCLSCIKNSSSRKPRMFMYSQLYIIHTYVLYIYIIYIYYTDIACLVLKIPVHENHACLCIHNYIFLL